MKDEWSRRSRKIILKQILSRCDARVCIRYMSLEVRTNGEYSNEHSDYIICGDIVCFVRNTLFHGTGHMMIILMTRNVGGADWTVSSVVGSILSLHDSTA